MTEKTKKITKRDIYEAISQAMETGESTIEPQEIIDFCHKEIAALDRKAEKARENAAKKREEGDALLELVRNALTDEYSIIADITARIESDEVEVTVAKVQYRLNQLIQMGEAEKSDVSVGETGSKRTLKGYRKIATIED